MRSLTSAANILLVSALFVTAAAAGQGSGGTTKKPETKAPPAHEAQPGDGVPRITQAEARDAFEKGKAIFVDVRGEDSFRVGHIKGALWMPDIAQRVKELPRDKMIITYCS
jgi:3-mercaptopyruvate sulfurtransferase SseA